jgi:Kef-type K+ transport system membrane component KefB
LTIGFLLNTKGLVELVVLNVGLDIGVLTKEIFAAFVVMAIWCLPLPPSSCFFPTPGPNC